MRIPMFHLPHLTEREAKPRTPTDTAWMWSLAVLLGALALVALLAAVMGYAYPPAAGYPEPLAPI